MEAKTKRIRKKKEAAPESAAASTGLVQDPSDLPGMKGRGVERLVILPLEKAADEVDRLKEKQARLKDDLDTAIKDVRDIMRENDITSYNYKQKRIERSPKDDAIKIKHTADYVGETVTED